MKTFEEKMAEMNAASAEAAAYRSRIAAEVDSLIAAAAPCAELAPGDQWGRYWKHPDGWMRLYPPTADELAIAEMRKPDPTPWE